MASTAGKRSARVTTERSVVTASDFAKEVLRLDGTPESINMMIYGDSNAGKTVLAGTCPGRCLWFIGEPGYKSAVRFGATGYGRRITNTATALASIDWLYERNRYDRFDWIILDGLSTMQDRFRLAYAAEAFDIDPSKRQHRGLPDRPDYFSTQNFLKLWIPQLVDLPVNLLITAHAYRTDRTDNGELLGFPGIQGKTTEVANAISGLMDVTGYLACRKLRNRKTGKSREVRRLFLQSPGNGEDSMRYVCGDKFNALGPYMDNATIPAMLARINGEDADA